MRELESLISAARSGNTEAYGQIVRTFQDMAVGMVAEGRWYAGHFLQRAIECRPAWSEPLQEAVASFEDEHQLMGKLWGLVGGFDMSDERVTAFADPATRAQTAPIICQARDTDAKAADAMEPALTL